MAITSNYVSEKIFTTNGDQTHLFLVGIRIRALCGATYKYGTVEDATYVPAITTVTLTDGSDDLDITLVSVEVGVAAPGATGNVPIHVHDASEGSGGPISASATDHATLTHLDYATAGHTNFQPAGDYATNAKVDTTSGTLQDQIDNFSGMEDHANEWHTVDFITDVELTTTSGTLQDQIDGIVIPTDFYSRAEVDTISGTLNTKVDTTSGTLQDQINNFEGMEDHANEWHTLDFITDAELTVASGVLQDQIDGIVIPTDFYSRGEVDTISGTLNDKIDTTSGTLQSEIDGITPGVSAHASLTQLDYASAGHTGFQPAGNYATTAEVDTVSGTLNDKITLKVNTSDFTELAQDVIGTSVSGINITVSYNDGTGITTLSGGAGGGGISNIVEDLTPELGGELDTNSKNIRLTPVPADDSASGLIATLTVDTNAVGVGCALYMAADGNFDEADADSATKMPCTALALETGTGSKKVLLMGFMRNDDWAWTVGGLIYVSITQGVLTQTAPSATGNQVQLVGYATHADRMYFNPIIAIAEVK